MSNKTRKLTEQTFAAEALRKDGTPVLVDFWASWCGPCRAMEPILESLAEELEGKAVIAKVNVDEEPGLAGAARVQSIPTMLLLQNGEVKDVFIGVTSKAVLQSKILSLSKAA
ncbi:MAG: thioredoxin [Deltaproteobacteria bacterium]|nr:thioredoxin [Deltaproteobacteria bacterium]